MPDSLVARIEVDAMKRTVTYHVSGMNTMEASGETLVESGKSAPGPPIVRPSSSRHRRRAA